MANSGRQQVKIKHGMAAVASDPTVRDYLEGGCRLDELLLKN